VTWLALSLFACLSTKSIPFDLTGYARQRSVGNGAPLKHEAPTNPAGTAVEHDAARALPRRRTNLLFLVRRKSMRASSYSKFALRRLPSSRSEFKFLLEYCRTRSAQLLSRWQRLPRSTAAIVESVLGKLPTLLK
jgi:hypothetical protein